MNRWSPDSELNPELFRPVELIASNLHTVRPSDQKNVYRLITADYGMTSRKERLKYN